MNTNFFTSESVTEGHPDKVCDQISDAILDAYLSKDKNARVACETMITRGTICVTGEISSSSDIDIHKVIKNVLYKIGYDTAESGFDTANATIIVALKKQSPDIALGVNEILSNEKKIGAGDQGMMFGFACNDTDCFMPAPLFWARKLTDRLTEVRKDKKIPYLYPDGKSQVTVEYINGQPVRIENIVISAHHKKEISNEVIHKDIMEKVILSVIPQSLFDTNTKVFINPTGRFTIGGPEADAGVTGRKIIVDTYGGMASHGGGAFSGKDPTKVDRSGAYLARYLAKNIVASGLVKKCEIQLSYVIGQELPISIYLNTFNTGEISEKEIIRLIYGRFDLRLGSIIDNFRLKDINYEDLAAHGHFGRTDINLPWEKKIVYLESCKQF